MEYTQALKDTLSHAFNEAARRRHEFVTLEHVLLALLDDPGSGKITASYAAVAKHYGVSVKICPPRRGNRKGVVEKDNHTAAQRCWRVIAQTARVFGDFRARFLGKVSPVHFWWGGFDLACTRFSGRPAPRHPGGIPNLADWVTREAYSHECISAGWWPGTPGADPSAWSRPPRGRARPAGCRPPSAPTARPGP